MSFLTHQNNGLLWLSSSLLDGQPASREVTNYLHEEYHMVRDYQPTIAQLRNM